MSTTGEERLNRILYYPSASKFEKRGGKKSGCAFIEFAWKEKKDMSQMICSIFPGGRKGGDDKAVSPWEKIRGSQIHFLLGGKKEGGRKKSR